MKKILNIITRLNIGGATIHVVHISDILKEKYNSKIIAGSIEPHEQDMSYYANKYKVKIKYLNKLSRELSFPGDLFALIEMYKLIKSEKPDIVHTHTAKAGTLGRIAAFFAGVPVIIHTFHGNVFKGYFSSKKTNVFIMIEKLLALISTKIIAISEKQKQELLDLKICKRSKIEVIKLGFDFENFLPGLADKNNFKRNFAIPDDAITIGIVGRITAIKNHKLFLEIVKGLINIDERLYFCIIGDGDLRNEIQADIERFNLMNRVIITGFITNLKPVYADLDFVISTSINEGTPVALIEAMACGKIVLSSNVGGVSDFIKNTENGFVFDDLKPEGYINCIIDLLNHKYDIQSLSEKATQTANDMFSLKRLSKEMLTLLDSLSG